MIVMKRVLVPTDFSDISHLALQYGVALTQALNASLYLLHVVPLHLGGGEDSLPPALMANMRERVSAMLAQQQKPCRAVSAVEVGLPGLKIIRYAEDHAIDLIVIGMNGHGFVTHMPMSSVAQRVARKAPCPVLTVRHPQHESRHAVALPADVRGRIASRFEGKGRTSGYGHASAR